MRYLFSIAIVLTSITSFAQQKWQPGYVMDVKGRTSYGLIQPYTSGKGPLPNEGFIKFKADEKDKETKVAAGDLQYVVAGRDSFVVAQAPHEGEWGYKNVDFVLVMIDEPLKLYAYSGITGGGGGLQVRPEVGAGIGFGSFGTFGGGGIGLSIGTGLGGGRNRTVYYTGTTTADMRPVTSQNFADMMSDVMIDEPQAVDAIRSGKYSLGKMNKLLDYYYFLRGHHMQQQPNR